MKISIIAPPDNFSGGMKVTALYGKLLTELGHRVTVYAVNCMPRGRRGRLFRRFAFNNRTLLQDNSYFTQFGVDWVSIDKPWGLSDSDLPDADYIIATWWETARYVARLPESKGRKVYFVQGHEVFDDGVINQVIETLKNEDFKLITISTWLKNILRNEYARQSTLVLNGIDTQRFINTARVKQQQPTLGFLYAPHAVKGFDIAQEVVSRLQTSIDFKVVSFGSVELPVKALQVTDLEFHHQPDQALIPSIYSSADVWICTSYSEGFALPILEALASGTPVVSTRTGCAEDLIDDGYNGYIVEIGDSAQLASRVLNILESDETEWRKMSDNAFESARPHTWENAGINFEKALSG